MTSFEASAGRRENPAPVMDEWNSNRTPRSSPATEPPPIGALDEANGRRVVAALVDLVLLCGLLAILGFTVGQFSVQPWYFSVSLSGWWGLLYVALGLVYYFAFEATTGQTLGKRLLGMRVFTAQGGRPTARAIAGRTLLRLVDSFPVMYPVGMITMLVTGGHRLGDLAAKTVVARAVPARRRSLALLPLALVVLAVVGLSVRWAGGTKTYGGHGVSFDYPARWRQIDVQSQASAGHAEERWTVAVGPGGRHDLVSITAYQTEIPVTPENVDAVEAQFEELIRRLYQQEGGVLLAGPEELTAGGKPGFRFRGTETVEGADVEAADAFVFDGTTEYQVHCQSTREKRAEIRRGCDQLVRSLTLSTTNPTPPPPTAPETATPTPAPTGLQPLTAAERGWLAALPRFMQKVDNALGQQDVYLTPTKMREYADLLRGCHQLARNLPSSRLRPVYGLVLKACREYDKGAACFAAAARIGIPFAGSAEDRAFARAIDCGFAAGGDADTSLADAINKGEEIKVTQ
jgi:uncharacterized RDD family membrane protein YckC